MEQQSDVLPTAKQAYTAGFPHLLHLADLCEQSAGFGLFIERTRPAPLYKYFFPFEGSCFFDALFYREGNGGLDSLLATGRSTPVVEKSDLYFFGGAVFFLNIPGIPNYTPSAIPEGSLPGVSPGIYEPRRHPKSEIMGTAPGRLAEQHEFELTEISELSHHS